MNTTEKLCLKWNNFKENISSSFGELRGDRDLTDVTLACEDGQQVEAHRVILASSSPFFMEILKRNKHPHPLIYMRGLKSEDLLPIIDFLYYGETNVLQENLDSFLALAEELRLKGLAGTSTGECEEPKQEDDSTTFRTNLAQKEKSQEQRKASNLGDQNSRNSKVTTVAVTNNEIIANLQDLDQQIKTMMTTTDVRSADGKGYVATCNICGKEAPSRNMPSHIEANHITGVSHACDTCGKVSRSRDSLRKHKCANR